MATHAASKWHLAKFWDDEFKSLEYIHEEFNDPDRLAQWTALGYPNRFTGEMCDWRSPQPSWNQRFIDIFASKGWKDIGTSYYRMLTGTVLPTHGDLYKRYVDVFDLQGREDTIRRAIVFLEDWQPGHYSEYMDTPMVDWRAGDTIEWVYDTPHAAANIGITPRYTLQITGHL
jgi:hypothetical protein